MSKLTRKHRETRVASVLDVANYILEIRGRMTAMKLQKLVYYAQAWSLVWDEKALFQEPIEAWANGPVAPMLYQTHKGRFEVDASDIRGNPAKLDAEQQKTIDKVLEFYGDKSSQWLSDLTHSEPPWKDARAGLSANDRGEVEISHAAMAEYYGGL